MERYRMLSNELLIIKIHIFSNSFSDFKKNTEKVSLEINEVKRQLKEELISLLNESIESGIIAPDEIHTAKELNSNLVMKFFSAARRTERNLQF